MRKRKTTVAEQLVNSYTLREVCQLRLVNLNRSFIVKGLVNELLYRDFREDYTTFENTLISNVEEMAYSYLC